MPDEERCRVLAREALRAGKLPRGDPERTWSGPGHGELCDLCQEQVTPLQMIYEVEFGFRVDTPRPNRWFNSVRSGRRRRPI